MYIDTHAHIYTEEFNPDMNDVVQSAYNQGVTKIYMPNIDSTSIDAMLHVASSYGHCYPMMGLHPCSVKENYKAELELVEKYMSDMQFYGVGETGIDLYWDKSFAEEQIIAFKTQISMAKNAGLPIIIHSRESLDLTISTIRSMQDGNLKGVFHCFNGDVNQATQIMDTGFYMGIGGVITYKNAGVDKVVADIPMEYLVLETDAPYLSPVPNRGKRNEPAFILDVARKLAEIKQLSMQEVADVTTENAEKLFENSVSFNR